MSTLPYRLSLNFKGYPIPLAVMKLSKYIKEIPIGEKILITSIDAEIIAELEQWISICGQEIEHKSVEGLEATLLIKRTV